MISESRRHLRRMVNKENAERILQFVKADNNELRNIPPIYALMDMTWNCNYECKGCIDTKSRDGQDVVFKKVFTDPLKYDPKAFKGKFLDKSIIHNVVDYAKKYKLRGIQLMGGETLLHPDIDEILCLVAKNSIPIELVSNGSFINEHIESLKNALSVPNAWLRVSVNAWSRYGERIGWENRSTEIRETVFNGIKKLIEALPTPHKDRIFVSTVAFEDALDDFEKLVNELRNIGLQRMVVIRERDPELKEFLQGQGEVKDRVIGIVNSIKGKNENIKFRIDIADNIKSEPIAQVKEYSPCPSVFLKAILGADGYLYTCTDHRGSKNARLVNIHDYNDDFEKAWHSQERVKRALAWKPKTICKNLVCQRFEGNECIDAFRQQHNIWTF